MARKKSILDDILSGIGNTTSNIASSVSKLSTPTVKAATTFADNFVKGYQNQIKIADQRSARDKQKSLDFTKNILNTSQKIGNNILNISQKTSPDFIKPNVAGFKFKTPEIIENAVVKTLPATGQRFKATTKAQLGNWMSMYGKFLQDTPVTGNDPTQIALRLMGIDVNKMTPKIFGGQKTTLGQVAEKIKPGYSKGFDESIQNLLDDSVVDSARADEMASKVDVGATGDWTKDLANPAYLLKALTLNGPSFATSLLSAGAITFLTKNPMVGLGAGFVTSHGQNTGDAYLDAKHNGADEQVARQTANFVGVINGALDTFGIGKVLNIIPGGKQARGLILKNILGRMTESALVEGTTESMQQIIQNAVAKVYYDHQRDIFAGIPESFVIGGLMGGGASPLSFSSLQIPPQTINNNGQVPTTPSPETSYKIDPIQGEPTSETDLLKTDMQNFLSNTDNKQTNIEQDTSIDFDLSKREAEGIMKGLFSPEEVEFRTRGVKDIITEDGQFARGKYFDSIIDVVEQNGKVESKTVYHEAFHAYADKFVEPELYKSAINELVESEGIDVKEAPEVLAENFADYVTNKKTFTGKVLEFFQTFLNNFMGFTARENSAQMIYQSILNKNRPVPTAQQGIQGGITSAQPASAITADILVAGQTLFDQGNIDEGLSKLQEATKITEPELNDLFNKYGVDITRLETDTHGLYFSVPEPSYWVQATLDSEANFIQALAEFAQNHNQESFITAKRVTGGAGATPGLTLDFTRPLSNEELLTIEKIANDQGIGLTLNQRTGEARAYNINEFDGMTTDEFKANVVKIAEGLLTAGFDFKSRVDNYSVEVYNSNQYGELIGRGQQTAGEAGGINGGIAGEQYSSDNPQYRTESDPRTRGAEISQSTPEVRRVRRLPNPDIRLDAQNYNERRGLPPIKENVYLPVNEAVNRNIGEIYDALPEIDYSPETQRAYAALGAEVQAQWDFATRDLRYALEPWVKDGQPYKNSQEMVDDVRNNRHLYFFTGGETHPFLGRVDQTGLSINDKFRAIHDLFGHASEGYGFGPRGEENAWMKHSQMFSPEAQRALTTETRGQSSWVNFGPQNYDADGNYLNIPPQDRPYAKQKVALLPPEFANWQSALSGEQPLFTQQPQYRRAEPQLPQNLKGAKPTYNYQQKSIDLRFRNDVDKAIYIVGNTKKLSPSDGQYMAFLQEVFPNKSEAQIRALGQTMRNQIKAEAIKVDDGGVVVAPSASRPFTPTQTSPAQSQPEPVVADMGIFKNITDIENYDNLLSSRPSGTDVGKLTEIVMMTPDEYLSQIPKSQPTQSSIDFMKAKLAKGEQLPMAILDDSSGTLTQEGRNRAYLAKEMGITEMPVLKVSRLISQDGAGPSEPKVFEKKPGQINVNNLDLTDAQKQHILDVAKTGDYESLSNDTITKLAESAGIDTKKLTKSQQAIAITRKFNTRRRVVELEKQADKLKTDGAPIEDIAAAELEIANMREITEAQASEEGRALQARKILADEFNTPRQRVYAILDEAGIDPEVYTKAFATVDFKNADQVVATYRELVPARWHDWIDKVRYGSMLSSINTHIINLASNFQGAGLITPVDLMVQGLIDKAANIMSFGQHKRTRFTQEGIEYAKGFYGAQYGSLKNAFTSFFDPIWDQGKEIDIRFIPLTKPGSKGRVVENIIDAPGRLLAVEDKFALSAVQQGFKKALEYRQNRGVKVHDIVETSKQKGQKVIFTSEAYAPGEGAVSDSIGFIASRLQSFTTPQVTPYVRWPAKFTMPFIRIGTNLFKRGIEYNPALGLLNMKNNTNKIEQASHIVIGSAAIYGAFKLAAAGLLQGAYEKDKTKREQQKDAGILDWSVKIAGPDGKMYNLQFNKMHPLFGFQLGLVASIFQAVEDGKLEEDKGVVIMDALARTVAYTNDQTYWRNVGDFVDVMGGDPYAITNLMSNYPSQLIPFRALGGWITRIIDEYQRAPDPDADMITQFVQRIQGGIPLLSTGVPTKKGPYGEDVQHPNRLFNLITPYKTSMENPAGVRVYEQMRENSYLNKIKDKNGEVKKELEKSLIQLSPEELRTKKGQDLQKEIDKSLLKLGMTPSESENLFMFVDPMNPTEVKTIDLAAFKTPKTGIDKYKQEEAKYSAARQIFSSPKTDEEKAAAYQTLGLKDTDVEYDYYASSTDENKSQFLLDEFQDKDHEYILNALVGGRVESISGNVLASNKVISDMEDEGLISASEAKALRAIKYNSKGDLIKGAGKKVKLGFKIAAPKLSSNHLKLTRPTGSSGNIGGSTGGLTLKKLKIQAPKTSTTPGQSKFKSGVGTVKIRPMVRNISSLGQL